LVTTAASHIPDRGDIVYLDFTPHAGHEQAGRRPGLVLSPALYNNSAGGLMLCCPITSKVKGYPFEVAVANAPGSNVQGVILADHIRSVDWRARNAAKAGRITVQCLDDVAAKIKTLIP
jgi:mRNA interferase MazF